MRVIRGTIREWIRKTHKLTDLEVEEILTWCRKRVIVGDLSYEYGVSNTTIRNIRDGRTHRKVFLRWCALTALRELKEKGCVVER